MHDFGDGWACTHDGCDAIDESRIETKTYSNFTGNNDTTSDGYFDRENNTTALNSAKGKDSAFDGVAIYQPSSENKPFATTLTLSSALKADISSAIKLEIRYYMYGSNSSTLDIKDKEGTVIFKHDHQTTDAWYTFTIEDASVIATIADEGVIRFANKAKDTYFAIDTIKVEILSQN